MRRGIRAHRWGADHNGVVRGVDHRMLDPFLDFVWERAGTDLHITAGAPPLGRIDGLITPIPGAAALTPEGTEAIVRSMLDDAHLQHLGRARQLDFSFDWKARARLRANAFFQRGSLALALRIIPYAIPTFADLGLPTAVERFVHLPQGLVIVTGPTGSGKSTTLASVIHAINEARPLHIVTIEDPIEYVHRHRSSVVNQREVGVDCTSFEAALRGVLREDPDVILLGEMRDLETIQTALTMAETGHLVFTTLHTNDAATAVDRIVDVFPAERQSQIRVQLANTLAGIIAQRLLPRVGGGRVAAFEVLVATYAVRNLVREGKSPQLRNAIATGAEHGMQTLEAALSDLVARRLVAYDDACRASLHPREICPA